MFSTSELVGIRLLHVIVLAGSNENTVLVLLIIYSILYWYCIFHYNILIELHELVFAALDFNGSHSVVWAISKFLHFVKFNRAFFP